ncbi:MAG: enoyl-CoA hydratase/isomerase family protein [Dehalococcoidia bacterium]|nr:enoyl-CoA hydratase/isomerase family protein [Dehalococcoidia bacterium]
MDYQNLLYEKQRNGVLITLNRPEVMNAISDELDIELHHALDAADADPEVRAIVLTGAGQAFSAGFDIAGGGADYEWPYGLPKGGNVAAEIDRWRTRFWKKEHGRIARVIDEIDTPIIAVVSGWCMGGGSWYALTSHITIAAEDAVFGQVEVRMISDDNYIWIHHAGYKNGLRYALTGDHIDAQEALRIGIVNKVVPTKDDALEEAFQLTERLALVSPETVKINLAVAMRGIEMQGIHNVMRYNSELAAAVIVSKREDFTAPLEEARKEGGLRAFIRKRDEPFQPEPFGPRSAKAREEREREKGS